MHHARAQKATPMCCQETKWTLHDGIRQCTTQHTLSTETNSCSIRSNSLKRKNCLRQVWEGKKTAARMSNIEEMPHGCHHDTVNTIIRSNKLQERLLVMYALHAIWFFMGLHLIFLLQLSDVFSGRSYLYIFCSSKF